MSSLSALIHKSRRTQNYTRSAESEVDQQELHHNWLKSDFYASQYADSWHILAINKEIWRNGLPIR